jgi:hypothetical protein
VLPLAGLGVVCRVGPSRPPGRRRALGEPPWAPGCARVSNPTPSGQRLKTTEGHRSRLDRTALVAPYLFGSRVRLTAGPRWSAEPDFPPVRAWEFPTCVPVPVGPVRRWAGPAGQIWPAVYFFLGISVYNFSRSANFNNSQKNKYKSFLCDSNFYE